LVRDKTLVEETPLKVLTLDETPLKVLKLLLSFTVDGKTVVIHGDIFVRVIGAEPPLPVEHEEPKALISIFTKLGNQAR
jgi:hypothetical protein